MRYLKTTGLILIFTLSCSLSSEITIDGSLDEAEWKKAQVIDRLYEVFPYSLREVNDYKTQILIIESDKGLYFGFKNYQTNETMRINNHLRDQERAWSDKNGIVIDFDGDSIEGYNFFISSSGSVGDATVTDEKERNEIVEKVKAFIGISEEKPKKKSES